MLRFPALHRSDQVEVVSDRRVQTRRIANGVEDVRLVVGAGTEVTCEVFPASLVERVAHAQQHAMFVIQVEVAGRVLAHVVKPIRPSLRQHTRPLGKDRHDARGDL